MPVKQNKNLEKVVAMTAIVCDKANIRRRRMTKENL